MFSVKNLYEMLNVRGLDLTCYEEIPLSQNEKNIYLKKAHCTIRSKKRGGAVKRAVIAAAIILGLISIVQQVDKIALADIPIVGNMLEEYLHRQDNSLADYKQVLNTSITDQGITATLNEVLINEDQIFISTTFTSKSIDWNSLSMPKLEISVNGTPLSGINIIKGQKKVISPDSVNFLSIAELKELDPNTNNHIELKYTEIINKVSRQQSIKGNWCFNFQARTETLLSQTRTILINRNIKIKNGQQEINVLIENLEISPLSATLNYRCLHNNDCSEIKFTMTDNNGLNLENNPWASSNERQKEFQPLNKDVKALIITPYITRPLHNHNGQIYDRTIKGESIEIKIN